VSTEAEGLDGGAEVIGAAERNTALAAADSALGQMDRLGLKWRKQTAIEGCATLLAPHER
jgi:hypothetical protein